MKTKKNLIILIFTIIIYFIFSYVYNNFIISQNMNTVYVLKKDITKGEKITSEDVEKITIKSTLNIDYIKDIKDDIVAINNLYQGKILVSQDVKTEKEYISINEGKEMISIKIKATDDTVSNTISKGSIVNIFYTLKKEKITNDLIGIENVEYIQDMLTMKILENVEVIAIYDSEGIEIKNTQDTKLIDTLLIQVSKEESIKIKNIKEEGNFSCSLIK